MVKLKKKIRKMETKSKKQILHYVSIPKSLFDTGVLNLNSVYNITIEEVIVDGQTNG